MFALPRQIAGHLKSNLGLTGEQEEVARYTLEVVIYGAYALLGAALAGWALGCLGPTLVVALTVFVLRCFSGGAHSNSPWGCFVLSVVLIPFSGKFIVLAAPLFTFYSLGGLIIPGFVLFFWLTWRLAPVDTPAKPVSSAGQRLRLKVLSLLTVVFVFLLQGGLLVLLPWSRAAAAVLALEAGLCWQVFSLTDAGHRLFAFTDNFKSSA